MSSPRLTRGRRVVRFPPALTPCGSNCDECFNLFSNHLDPRIYQRASRGQISISNYGESAAGALFPFDFEGLSTTFKMLSVAKPICFNFCRIFSRVSASTLPDVFHVGRFSIYCILISFLRAHCSFSPCSMLTL